MSDDDPVRDPAGDSADDRPLRPADPVDDPMGPPKEPCECWCMHCSRTFMSSEIWFQRVIGDPHGFEGFWMCPTPNCSGAGFCFDIFPTDPNHPANGNGSFSEEGDEEEYDPEAFDEILDVDGVVGGPDAEWDPEESKWQQLGDALDDDDENDLEGEEWKYGLEPGERPESEAWIEEIDLEQEEIERMYDEPDERPRELDWSDRKDPRRENRPPGDDEFREDDIPF